MAVTEQTFYWCKKTYAGMGVAEVRRLRFLEDENRKLKPGVTELSLQKKMLSDVLSKKSEARGSVRSGGCRERRGDTRACRGKSRVREPADIGRIWN